MMGGHIGRKLAVISLFLGGGAAAAPLPSADATAVGSTEPHPHRGPAPATPLTFGEAGRLWDGTGELLLRPNPATRRPRIVIGAAFDNSDAVDPDLERDRSALGRCMATIYGASMHGGSVFVEGREDFRIRGAPVQSTHTVDGRVEHRFAVDRCRYALSVALLVPGDGGWVAAVPPPPPPPPVPIGPVTHLKSGQTITVEIPPAPRELSNWTWTSRLGPVPQASLEERCPDASGTLTLDGGGAVFEMPWDARDAIVPGVRRDPVNRATTLIFQKPECRLEITVTREILDDDGWRRSALSPIPLD